MNKSKTFELTSANVSEYLNLEPSTNGYRILWHLDISKGARRNTVGDIKKADDFYWSLDNIFILIDEKGHLSIVRRVHIHKTSSGEITILSNFKGFSFKGGGKIYTLGANSFEINTDNYGNLTLCPIFSLLQPFRKGIRFILMSKIEKDLLYIHQKRSIKKWKMSLSGIRQNH